MVVLPSCFRTTALNGLVLAKALWIYVLAVSFCKVSHVFSSFGSLSIDEWSHGQAPGQDSRSLRSGSRRLRTLRLQPGPECARGLGRCCHRELPLLLTDVLFLPRPISEAQAWLRYHCLPCPCSQHCGLQTLTPKGVAVLYCPANRPDLSARLSGGAGREGGVCLLSSLLNIWWENLFRLLAHGFQRFSLPPGCRSLCCSYFVNEGRGESG